MVGDVIHACEVEVFVVWISKVSDVITVSWWVLAPFHIICNKNIKLINFLNLKVEAVQAVLVCKIYLHDGVVTGLTGCVVVQMFRLSK